MQPVVCDVPSEICLGCHRCVPTATTQASMLSSVFEKYPLCFTCKTKEKLAFIHIGFYYSAQEAEAFQNLMRDGYRQRQGTTPRFTTHYWTATDNIVLFSPRITKVNPFVSFQEPAQTVTM